MCITASVFVTNVIRVQFGKFIHTEATLLACLHYMLEKSHSRRSGQTLREGERLDVEGRDNKTEETEERRRKMKGKIGKEKTKT